MSLSFRNVIFTSDPSTSPDASVIDETAVSSGVWQSIKYLWCRHTHTTVTPKRDGMPAHVVCQSCGWREPIMAAMPLATRTWDSSRDEERYQFEKRRRVALEQQRQIVMAKHAAPTARRPRRPRAPVSNIFPMKPAAGQ